MPGLRKPAGSRESTIRAWYLASVALLTVLLVFPALGQYVSDPPPVDSAYWWTLSEDLSPQELYGALQSRERNQQRLREAIEEGRYEVIPESRIEDLALYIDGRETPELWPMWHIFSAFADRFSGYRPDYHETAQRELVERGMSEAGASQVVAAADRTWRRERELNLELHPLQQKFAREVLAPAEQALSRSQARKVIARKDFTRLSMVSGMDRASIADLHRAWRRDAAAEVGVDALERLRAVLEDSDWQVLRSFLRTEVAPVLDIAFFSARGLK